MTKYRKKPVVIEAELYTPGMEDGFEERIIYAERVNGDFGMHICEEDVVIQVPYIETLEGRHQIRNGDWIITVVKGERYPIRSDIFEETYELVTTFKEDMDDKMTT